MWKVNKRESENEKIILEIEKRIDQENKAIKYLKIIKEEIKDIIVYIEAYINLINENKISICVFSILIIGKIITRGCKYQLYFIQ